MKLSEKDKRIFQLHADVSFKSFHTQRLEILHILKGKEVSVRDIVMQMGISKANVSQHLAIMRKAGILNTRREGLNAYYRISSPKIARACNLMREVLLKHHIKRGNLLMNQVQKERL
ncbi:MAG: metalloregulator ArsR/SmtB family transcription factor [Deltaproteobacteria bacterium]|nr:metalloregulator ArsR/SmtB family transcription factor [Deltaproteobacteria bacterium]